MSIDGNCTRGASWSWNGGDCDLDPGTRTLATPRPGVTGDRSDTIRDPVETSGMKEGCAIEIEGDGRSTPFVLGGTRGLGKDRTAEVTGKSDTARERNEAGGLEMGRAAELEGEDEIKLATAGEEVAG